MFQQRPFFTRCILACLLALIAILTLSALSRSTTAQAAPPSPDDKSTALTSTLPIELAPDDGAFIDTGMNSLPGVQNGSAIWGDCNNDGAADVLLMGQTSSLTLTRVYQRNTVAVPFVQAAVLTGVIHGAAAWGDYDNDGRLDIALTGDSADGPITQIWHNDWNGSNCAFSLIATNLITVDDSSVAWGDYNADGQLDLVVAGNHNGVPVTKLYRNNHGSFIGSGLSLPGIQNGAAVWGDYDNDGFADILLTGSTAGGAPLTTLFHNDGHGALIDAQAGLPAFSDSAAAWGDYNNDGYLDLLLEGTNSQSVQVAEIYNNEQGTFVKSDVDGNLVGSQDWTGAAWGDFDTDGYLDALVSTNSLAAAYRNVITGSFAGPINVGTSSLIAGSAAWGDYDNDLNLDVLLTGRSLSGLVTKIYRYSLLASNTPPYAPTLLTPIVEGTNVTLRWSPPITPDDHTPLSGLSYNLRVGTQPGGIDLVAPQALTDTGYLDWTQTGYRLLPQMGNANSSLSMTLRGLPLGRPIYWSVQAIDTSFVGSNFAANGVFQIPYRVFVPVVMKNVVGHYNAAWESEPNNSYLQANGALNSGQIYRGLHNDEKDYYSVYLQAAGTVNVDMNSSNGGTQLQLFYQVADVAHRVGFDPTPPYHISYSGSPGWYYIYVYTNPTFAGTEVYTLAATYP